MLLIVPYGIETDIKSWQPNPRQCLLIVPYGIETQVPFHAQLRAQSFNRTLWN